MTNKETMWKEVIQKSLAAVVPVAQDQKTLDELVSRLDRV